MMDFLFGYTKEKRYMVENTPEQMAAFIMAHRYEDVKLVNFVDVLEIETSMGFIMYCRDQEFLRKALIPVLAPMQMGEVEPPEFRPLEEEDW